MHEIFSTEIKQSANHKQITEDFFLRFMFHFTALNLDYLKNRLENLLCSSN